MSVTIYGLDANRPHPRARQHASTVDLDFDDPAFVSWSNCNATVILALLGLESRSADESLVGDVAVHEARRGIIRARAMFDRRAPALERAAEVHYGAPRADSDGTVVLRPVRFVSCGLDAGGMRARLDAFERAVEALVARGATHIAWA